VLHLDGLSLRLIGRLLGVNHQTAANWINGYANYLPPDLPPSILELLALDGDIEDVLALEKEDRETTPRN